MSSSSEATEPGSQPRSAETDVLAGRLTSFEYAGAKALGVSNQGAVLPRHQVGDVGVLATPELTDEELHRRDRATQSLLAELAAEARAAAQSQGYAVGWAQGRRAAEAAASAEAAELAREAASRAAAADAARADEHRAALSALAEATAEIRALIGTLTERIEAQATTLAWELTSTLVGHEVTAATDADIVRRALGVLPDGVVATVRLHPSVASSAPAEKELRAAGLAVVPDPSLSRADVLVEYDGSVTDLRIDEALERVRQVLT